MENMKIKGNWKNEEEALQTRNGRAWLILNIENRIIDIREMEGLPINEGILMDAHVMAQREVLARMGKSVNKR